LSNDYSFNDVFARQVEALVRAGDAVLGLSTSGKSENVLKGALKAKELGAQVIIFTGAGGSRLAQVADIALIVPSFDTPRIQEGHITMGHVLCSVVEKVLFPIKE
jgi:D-sedoheptulose 7-phosphate isomerase